VRGCGNGPAGGPGTASAGGGGGAAAGPGGGGGGDATYVPAGPEPDEAVDFDPGEIARIDELEDATDVVTNGVELLKNAFGGEMITVDQTPTP
jgi:hypothetical protein